MINREDYKVAERMNYSVNNTDQGEKDKLESVLSIKLNWRLK